MPRCRTTGCSGRCCRRRHHRLRRFPQEGPNLPQTRSPPRRPRASPRRLPPLTPRFFPGRSPLSTLSPPLILSVNSMASLPGISRLQHHGTGHSLLVFFLGIGSPTTLRVGCYSSLYHPLPFLFPSSLSFSTLVALSPSDTALHSWSLVINVSQFVPVMFFLPVHSV